MVLAKVLTVFRWLIFGFFLLIAIITVGNGDVLAAVCIFLLGNLFIPHNHQPVLKKSMGSLSVKQKAAVGLILFIGFLITLSPSEPRQESALGEETTAITSSVGEETHSTLIEVGEQNESEYYDVVSITDGDTIKVTINGQTEIIRLANIDTPEVVDQRKPVQCLGREASQKMTELVRGKRVALEPDQTQADRDRYRRLVRFVFLEDGTDVGLEMINQGFAQSSPYGTSPHMYLEEYAAAQKTAQTGQKGLWNPHLCPASSPTPTPTPIPSPVPTPQSSAPVAPVQNFDSPGGAPQSGGGASTVQNSPAPQTPPPADNAHWSCDCKKTCPQMSSCAEAQWQLNNCGCSARDGDKDGLACDQQCG